MTAGSGATLTDPGGVEAAATPEGAARQVGRARSSPRVGLPSAGLPPPVGMEALDQAEGPAASPREMPPPPPPAPPSEPAQKPPPRGPGSPSLTVRSSLCLLAASQFLVRTSQASQGPESGRLEEEASTSSPKMAARGHGGPGTFWVSLGLV